MAQGGLNRATRLDIVCEECGATFSSTGSLGDHKRLDRCLGAMRKNAINPENPLQCIKCSKMYPNEKSINAHLSATIRKGLDCGQDLDCICGECGATFSNNGTLNSHLKQGRCLGATRKNAVNPDNHLQCFKCDTIYPSEKALNAHFSAMIRKGLDCAKEPETVCEECGATFSNHLTLREHIRSGSCLGSSRKKAVNPENPLQCLNCNKIYLSEKSLNAHLSATIRKGLKCAQEQEIDCGECGATFSNHGTLSDHIKLGRCLGAMRKDTINPNNPLQCLKCSTVYSNEKALNAHISVTIRKGIDCSKEPETVCSQCGITFSSRLTLSDHVRSGSCLGQLRKNAVNPENPLQCLKCKKNYVNEKAINAHISAVIRKGIDCSQEPETVCGKCGITFSNHLTLNEHIRSGSCLGPLRKNAVNPENPLQCLKCKTIYYNQKALNSHIIATIRKDCSKGPETVCGKCGITFSSHGTLSDHVRSGACLGVLRKEAVNPENPLQCLKCKTIYSSEKAINVHISTMVRKGIDCSKEPETVCGQCGITFSSHLTLSDHVRSGACLGVLRKEAVNPENPLQCLKCKTIYSSEKAINVHISAMIRKGIDCSKEPETVCGQCGISFSNHLTLNEHIRSGSCLGQLRKNAVNPENPLQCLKCKTIYHNEKALNAHISAVIRKGSDCAKDNKAICDKCGTTFSCRWNLTDHIKAGKCLGLSRKSFVNPENPLQCIKCKTTYSNEKALNAHIVATVRKGLDSCVKELPICADCGTQFARMDSLNEHVRKGRCHGKRRKRAASLDNPLQCSNWTKTFKNRVALGVHIAEAAKNGTCDQGADRLTKVSSDRCLRSSRRNTLAVIPSDTAIQDDHATQQNVHVKSELLEPFDDQVSSSHYSTEEVSSSPSYDAIPAMAAKMPKLDAAFNEFEELVETEIKGRIDPEYDDFKEPSLQDVLEIKQEEVDLKYNLPNDLEEDVVSVAVDTKNNMQSNLFSCCFCDFSCQSRNDVASHIKVEHRLEPT